MIVARKVGDDLWTTTVGTTAPVGNSDVQHLTSPPGLVPCAILGTRVEQPHPR